MSGVRDTITFDMLAAYGDLGDLLARIENAEGFYQKVGGIAAASAGQNFDDERGPDGTPWVRLKPKTIAARIRKGQNPRGILRASGGLRGSLHYETKSDQVEIGTSAHYSAIHQLGGTIQMPARAAKIYRKIDPATGKPGRRFVPRDHADHVADVAIPAHSITIPARPFLGLGSDDIRDIEAEAIRWLRG